MVKGSIIFPIDKKVDLNKLGADIAKAMQWKTYSSINDKDCFSGLNADEVEINGVWYNRILIVWTYDGVIGKELEDLSVADRNKIEGAISIYGG